MDQTVFSNNKTIEQVVEIITVLYSKRQRHYPEYEHDNVRDIILMLKDHTFTDQFLNGQNKELEGYMVHFFDYIKQRYQRLVDGHEDTEWCFGCIDEVLDEDGMYFHLLCNEGYPERWLIIVKELITTTCIQFMTFKTQNECIVNTLNTLQLIKKHLFK